ncbi:MAG: TolC family protein [Cyclobacteriaceae bacterium]|nr:TolC family protein [Cyclobacteriaceae bacterium]
MKPLLFLLSTFLVVLLSSGWLYSQDDRLYSLDDCIQFALDKSVQMKNARLDVISAEKRVGETRGIGLPQLSSDFMYTNNFAIQTVFLPAVFFADDPATVPADAPPVGVRFGVRHLGQAGLNASQIIFDGSYIIGLQAASTYKELSQKALQRTEIETIENVTKAFYTVLINHERFSLMESNYQRLDTLYQETRMMYENGFVEKVDMDRVKLNFNNAKVQMQSLGRMMEVSKILLKFQMGMDVNNDIELKGKLSDLDLNINYQEKEQNFAYDNRIEFSLMQTETRLSLLDMKNSRAASFPKLSAFAGLGYNTGADQFSDVTRGANWFEYGNFGFSLSVPIFSGLQRSFRNQQAKISLMKNENSLKDLENAIDMEIIHSRNDLKNSLEALEIQAENIELAETVFETTKFKYQEGLGSNLEVIEADNALKEAQTNYFNAVFEVLVAKINYEKALGKLTK